MYIFWDVVFQHPHIFIVEGAVDALPKIWGGESTKTKLGLKIIWRWKSGFFYQPTIWAKHIFRNKQNPVFLLKSSGGCCRVVSLVRELMGILPQNAP